MKANANIMSFDNGLSEAEKNQAEERMEAARNNIELMKVNIQREQIASQERIKNKEIAISREQLLSSVWGYDFFGDDRTVDTHIKMLRNNLGEYRDLIVTVRGMGYKYEEK